MRILIVTPEANPFARSGALAEVIFGLSKALRRQGQEVMVALPYYRQVKEADYPVQALEQTLSISLSFKTLTANLYTAHFQSGLDFYFIGQDSLYDREGLYGTQFGDYQDNAERFIFFSRAIPELLHTLQLEVEVLNCHEWQTGLVPVYLRTLYRESPYCRRPAVVYTVHNVGYQGIFWHYDMALTGLPWELFHPKVLEFYGKLNLEKGGLIFADLINTISEQYRREILTPEFGFGLEGVFQERQEDLYAILNGVDYDNWDPSQDRYLPACYTPQNLQGKMICKQTLIDHFGLQLTPEQPLVGMTTRLVERKGLDLVQAVLPELLESGIGFVLQGTGEERYQYAFTELHRRYPGQVGVEIGYTDDLAHLIIAGSDIFLMPSRYEPCGQDQLYCLRYGTIPVVRAVGGLEETISDYNPATGSGTGFKFSDYHPEALKQAIIRALELFRQPAAWERLRQQVMSQEFSWDTAAARYVELFAKACQKRQAQLQKES